MTSEENRIQVAADILCKRFPNGLALDDSKQFYNFRDYFADELGDEADTLFNSKIREILEKASKSVGVKVGVKADFEDEPAADGLLLDPFEYSPLAVAAQEEDVLQVDADLAEPNNDVPEDATLLDFDAKGESIASTKPVLCLFRGETLIRNCDWSELYAAVMTRLLFGYPHKMWNRLNQSLGRWNKPDFVDRTQKSRFFRPVRIAENFYIETNNSAPAFSLRIRLALELCGVELDELKIWYRKTNAIRRNREAGVERRLFEPKSTNDVKETPTEERAPLAQGADVVRLQPPLSRTTFVYTKPVACYYKKERLVIGSHWSELYAAVITKLYDEYPQEIESKLNQSLGPWGKIDFADETRKARFLEPVKIANKFYIETHSSAYHIMQRIQLALELCGLDADALEIWYRKKESSRKTRNDGLAAPADDAELPFVAQESLIDAPADKDIFANAPELCRYRDEKEDDLDWL